MILVLLIGILMIGGLLAWLVAYKAPTLSRWISAAALTVNLAIVVAIWMTNETDSSGWIAEFMAPWIPRHGISFHLAVDGLSLLLLMLTFFLGIISVFVSWNYKERVGFLHFNLLWILAGISGVFMALDLFLFYFFWEVMLIPMYFIIGIWGSANRIYAAFKFFIFTQASGLLMFLAILGLYFIHGSQTGEYTFSLAALMDTELTRTASWLLMGGFTIAFVVKLPAIPFHNWLPDAHTEAPTPGSVILAGLLLKTGAYGLIRFVIPLFPESAADFAPYAMMLGALGILYGAKLAFAQTDLKRLVAYTSVSHMGFVLVGLFAFNELALQGTIVQLIAHGISTGALFIIVGALYDRTHTRDIDFYSGLWTTAPKIGAISLVFSMASLGLPGMANFIAEILILTGAFRANKFFTVLATIGLVAATVYSLRFFQKVFQGKPKAIAAFPDFNFREFAAMAAMMAVIFWIGLYPRPILDLSRGPAQDILEKSKTHRIIEKGQSNLLDYSMIAETEGSKETIQQEPEQSGRDEDLKYHRP